MFFGLISHRYGLVMISLFFGLISHGEGRAERLIERVEQSREKRWEASCKGRAEMRDEGRERTESLMGISVILILQR